MDYAGIADNSPPGLSLKQLANRLPHS